MGRHKRIDSPRPVRYPSISRAQCLAALSAILLGSAGHATQAHAGSDVPSPDPRLGLKLGHGNGGVALSGFEIVSSTASPPGFVDPEFPAGAPIRPREGKPPIPGAPSRSPSKIAFINTDLAFSGNRMVMGNYNGFNIYDVENPRDPKLLVSVVCPGGEHDVAVHGNLLFLGVEEKRSRIDCGSGDSKVAVSAERFQGVRIFDISDVLAPRQVAAVQTCRGSHTFTLLPDPRDRNTLYVYNAGVRDPRAAEELHGCSGKSPDEDPNTSLYSIDVIKVPLDAPERAAIVSNPRVFADSATGKINSLTEGGEQAGGQHSLPASMCHDITVYPELGLAAGACVGAGLLLDISDPKNPVRIDWVTDKNFGAWHSATFSNDATKVVFTDEWSSGVLPRCQAGDPPFWGGNGIWTIEDRKLGVHGYYKIPGVETEFDNCASHNGNLVPVPGRDILVQAWFQGGVSVMDFTDAQKPIEIAFYDRGPIAQDLRLGGMWSAYWYNGHVYSSDLTRGFDVLKLTPSNFLTKNEIAAAELVRENESNPQTQFRINWPATAVVGRAYLDQLTREGTITAKSRAAVERALSTIERNPKARGTFGRLTQRLSAEASRASGKSVERLNGIVRVLSK